MSADVPAGLLPQQITLVRPAQTVDGYGSTVQDYGPAATRTVIEGWLQQDRRQAVTGGTAEGRRPQEQSWLLVTNHPDVQALDRFEWNAVTFETGGPPEPVYTPRGFHHTEATLVIYTG